MGVAFVPVGDWVTLGDDELRARLTARLPHDGTFVDWLVIQRDNESVAPLVDDVLDPD